MWTLVFGTIWDYIAFSMCLVIHDFRENDIPHIYILIISDVYIFKSNNRQFIRHIRYKTGSGTNVIISMCKYKLL